MKNNIILFMKYVKLFESWLNEQDEPAGTTPKKEFSPAKSFETSVLDIQQKDIFTKNPEEGKKLLTSIVGRGVEKKSTDTKESTAVVVRPLAIEEMGIKKVLVKGMDSGSKLETLKLDNEGAFIKALDSLALDAKGIGDDAPKGFFIHTADTPENKIYWSAGEVKNGLSTQSAALVFLPREGNTKVNADGLLVDLPVVIVLGGKAKEATFGQLLALASTKFADASILDKADAGTKENLAASVFPSTEKTA